MNPQSEKMGLLILAGLSIGALTAIAVLSLHAGQLDANAATVIGVIVGGLIAFGKDIIQALRGLSMSAQLSKVTDQLAASGPVVDPAPADAKAAAQEVADASQDAADKVAG
jgi:hypothetical protein